MNEVAIRENISFDEAVKSARPFLDNKLSEIGMNQKLIEMALEGETDEIIRGQKIAYATKMFNDMFWRSFRVIKS
jgi:hypothetical protein